MHSGVNVDDVATILRNADTLQRLLLAADVMRPCSGHVRQEDTLDRCLTLFSRRQMEELPVVDQGRLVGVLARADVIRHYNREILRRDAVLKFVEEAEREGPEGERLQPPAGPPAHRRRDPGAVRTASGVSSVRNLSSNSRVAPLRAVSGRRPGCCGSSD